jgi:hypothetical protein
VDAAHMGADLEKVLITEEEILTKLDELAALIAREYEGKDLLLVGVLKGAVMVMADLMRALPMTAPVDWMAVSSYGSGTKSSGVVRILKDLDTDITGRHVLIVEDIIDSGLTLSWIKRQPRVAQPGLGRDLHPAAQARRRQGRGRRQVGRLRHPQRVRRRLRPRLRRAYRGFRRSGPSPRTSTADRAPYRNRPIGHRRYARAVPESTNRSPQVRPRLHVGCRCSDAVGTRGERGALLACTRPCPALSAGHPKRPTSRRTGARAPHLHGLSSASSRPRCSGCWPSSW